MIKRLQMMKAPAGSIFSEKYCRYLKCALQDLKNTEALYSSSEALNSPILSFSVIESLFRHQNWNLRLKLPYWANFYRILFFTLPYLHFWGSSAAELDPNLWLNMPSDHIYSTAHTTPTECNSDSALRAVSAGVSTCRRALASLLLGWRSCPFFPGAKFWPRHKVDNPLLNELKIVFKVWIESFVLPFSRKNRSF